MTNVTSKFRVLGVMSGTSLDGLDLALVEFEQVENRWLFSTIKSICIEYPFLLKKQLREAINYQAGMLNALDNELGDFIGNCILDHFDSSEIDFISSHGHTVYHQPNKGITLQIGNGHRIQQRTSLPVICDFRSKDVDLGGQGAPLVPIGDQLLFNEYSACLNLGGIANISYVNDQERIAYDITPFNMALNYLAQQIGLNYDQNGLEARKGNINNQLLTALNALPYYQVAYPKSLGLEDFEELWLPLLSSDQISIQVRLCTYVEHAAEQISETINMACPADAKNLITGGGAHNAYFIERLKNYVKTDICVPEKSLVDYKEAIIFAFLGLLRFHGKNNCLASVTGAREDSCSGKMIGF